MMGAMRRRVGPFTDPRRRRDRPSLTGGAPPPIDDASRLSKLENGRRSAPPDSGAVWSRCDPHMVSAGPEVRRGEVDHSPRIVEPDRTKMPKCLTFGPRGPFRAR